MKLFPTLAPTLAFVAVLALLALPARAHELTPEQLGSLRFDQHLGAQVPLDLEFRDENGTPITLGTYFDAQRPMILTLNYFHCQNLCSLELEGLANALNGVPFTLGNEFDVISVSIDPREGPADAAAARLRALRRYSHDQTSSGWHVLTGGEQAIKRLTDTVGFAYAYDAIENEFAHPLGAVVLTPSGYISRYLFGVDYAANDARLALMDASAEHIGSLFDRIALLCYHYDPLTGRYTPLALNLMRGGGAVGLVTVVLFLGWLWRSDLCVGAARHPE